MPLPSQQVHSLPLLPTIQSRSGTNALVLFGCRFAVSGRDMFTLTPNCPRLGRHFLRLYHSSLRPLPHHLLLAHFGKDGKPEVAMPKISQETLAEMVGTTRSRVNFFMNRFRKLGFVRYNGEPEVHSSPLNIVLHD
jgi:CRP-like cAMP-binding protein